MWGLDHKEGWVQKNWCLWTVVLEKTLDSPLDSKEIKQSILKEINPEYSLEGWMLKVKLQYTLATWCKELIHWKDHNAKKDWRQEEKGMAEDEISSVQSLNHVRLFATPWAAACWASLTITKSWSLLKLTYIELVMPSNHLILCLPLLLLPSIFPSIRVFYSELVLCIRWPKYWSFSFSISPSSKYSGLPLGGTSWISLQSKLCQESSPTSQHQFFGAQLSL